MNEEQKKRYLEKYYSLKQKGVKFFPDIIYKDLLVSFAIFLLLVGLAMICVGGFTSLNTLWEGLEKTIIADIGYRLVATGYVVAAASGMADVFGFGSQPFPAVPYFGQWQAFGVMAGQIIIIFGFVLMVPSPPKMKNKRPPEQITTQP